MGLDIIEIALNSITDSREFEKLASEVMRDEGYRDIHPLGGIADFGRDAIQNVYYESSKPHRIVFQYSLQRDVTAKVVETLKKLRSHKIEYAELVVVTTREILTHRQDDLKRTTRKDFGVALNVYDRVTLVNRLSNLSNGIFYRHFPDIEKQASVIVHGSSTQLEPSKSLEREQLRGYPETFFALLQRDQAASLR